MSSATTSGSCLCGSVQYTVSGTDKGAVLCHCSNCKQASGSAFANNHRYLNATLDFTSGADLVTRYADSNTKSGNTLLRHFCSKCGSPIYLKNPQVPDLVIVHVGSLSNGQQSKPKMELFPESRRPWMAVTVPPRI